MIAYFQTFALQTGAYVFGPTCPSWTYSNPIQFRGKEKCISLRLVTELYFIVDIFPTLRHESG
jgi:hypothetical protein